MRGPLARYTTLVAKGSLSPDPAQATAMRQLQYLAENLLARQKWSLFNKTTPARGLYLWGDVGRGKSLLMDIFFNNTNIARKKRVHFHRFMSDTHQAIAAWRAMSDRTRKNQPYRDKKASRDDPIPHVGKKISRAATLLCFDEFQVSDITDAMILGRLFDALLSQGTTIVATSNRPPDDLYRDGINRALFLPFIETIKTKLDIHHLETDKDYRRDQLRGVPTYFSPLTPPTKNAMDAAWAKIITGARERPRILQVRGRDLNLNRIARDAVRLDFTDLCAHALGAEDYLAIAENFATLFMDNIPILTPQKRNEAKRFVTLIDALYEAKTKFVCSAAALPEQLYPEGDGSFEFARTASRLREMQSEEYGGEER